MKAPDAIRISFLFLLHFEYRKNKNSILKGVLIRSQCYCIGLSRYSSRHQYYVYPGDHFVKCIEIFEETCKFSEVTNCKQ